jgi:transcription termination factor Rho
VTDTDLITADGSSDDVALSDTVNSPISEAVSTVSSEKPVAAAPARAAVVTSSDRPASLTAMVLPDLRALAGQLGIKGSSGMRKSELIAAIREHRGESNGAAAAAPQTKRPVEAKQAADTRPVTEPKQQQTTADDKSAPPADGAVEQTTPPRRERRGASRSAGAAVDAPSTDDQATNGQSAKAQEKTQEKADETVGDRSDKGKDSAQSSDGAKNTDRQPNQNRNNDRQNNGDRQGQSNNDRQGQNNNDRQGQNNNANNVDDDEDGDGRQGRRGRRFRDRKRRGERGDAQGGGAGDRDAELREDDVVQPVAGILDVLDNYAFVRTSGYLAGTNDVYVSMNMVRKNGLRRGDAIIGAVRVSREGEGGGGNNGNSQNPRQKFNPLVRLDSVNGGPVDDARNRPEFGKLTPLYPNQRLRLETTPDRLTTRVIDLIMPIGKGQRALIVSPPKAGKTMILQAIANAITTNNPECHLMVVLVDERPEEVTDMTRSVKGEVIASTFDRPPSDHTAVAELAIERAKRLVEQGKDVVVLLDSITRLGRAYNNASPASGRILSGGVDSTALYPPKRFLGAARNIEDGGSLTIIATAMVETGSTGDTVIFEEFKGTGNAELKLDRKIAERRVFPAVDVNPSGTRKDELLLSTDEFAVVHKLRRVLSGLDSHQAIDLLMSQLRKTKNNYEFLVQVSKTTPQNMDVD